MMCSSSRVAGRWNERQKGPQRDERSGTNAFGDETQAMQRDDVFVITRGWQLEHTPKGPQRDERYELGMTTLQ